MPKTANSVTDYENLEGSIKSLEDQIANRLRRHGADDEVLQRKQTALDKLRRRREQRVLEQQSAAPAPAPAVGEGAAAQTARDETGSDDEEGGKGGKGGEGAKSKK
jgi:hypothetical protein